MFPQPKTLLEHLTHSECDYIIEKGIEEPYTFNNLLEAPPEHTYQGSGREFLEYTKLLKREAKDLTFIRFLAFFKIQNLMLNLIGIFCNGVDFLNPLIMERFLRWINSTDSRAFDGLWILLLAIILIFIRVILNFVFIYYSGLSSVQTKNTMEVSKLFIKTFFFSMRGLTSHRIALLFFKLLVSHF